MVNVRSRIKAQTNTTKAGVGSYKKYCSTPNNVYKKPDFTHLSTVVSPNNTVSDSSTAGSLRKSDRNRNKINSEVMDTILKRELLIVDSGLKKPVSGKVKCVVNNNLNNNCLDVSNQNEKAQSKAPTPTKRKANTKYGTKQKEKRNKIEFSQSNEALKNVSSCNKEQNKTKLNSQNKTQINRPKPIKKIERDKNKTSNNFTKTAEEPSLLTIKCDYCQKPFENRVFLNKHLLTHEEWRPYICPLCPKRFRYNSTLKVHLQRNHPNASSNEESKYYTCTICNKAFMSPESFEEHFKTHVKKDTVYKCIFCDKQFMTCLGLIDHEKSHSTTKQFKCDYCVLNFEDEKSFWLHMVRHSSVKDLICNYCGKEFLRTGGLKRHVQACHNVENPAKKCPICNKKLKGHMSEHMRVHEQQRPHECEFCGQRFTQSTQLKVHKRSHTGARPYTCKICDRPFGHSNALMLHVRIHTGERPFQCTLCPLSFSQLPHMKTHMMKIHNQEHSYKCLKCDEYFKLKKQLDIHEASCKVERALTSGDMSQGVARGGIEKDMTMSLSALRFQVALLLSKVADPEQLKCLGFNKRLIDDLVEDSIEAIGLRSCKDTTISQVDRLKTNIEILFGGIVSQEQMDHFSRENKTIEEILVLLTGEDCATTN